jgi:hypothetical protein
LAERATRTERCPRGGRLGALPCVRICLVSGCGRAGSSSARSVRRSASTWFWPSTPGFRACALLHANSAREALVKTPAEPTGRPKHGTSISPRRVGHDCKQITPHERQPVGSAGVSTTTRTIPAWSAFHVRDLESSQTEVSPAGQVPPCSTRRSGRRPVNDPD